MPIVTIPKIEWVNSSGSSTSTHSQLIWDKITMKAVTDKIGTIIIIGLCNTNQNLTLQIFNSGNKN